MQKEKNVCSNCGRPLVGNNFLGFCSQECWKQSQKPARMIKKRGNSSSGYINIKDKINLNGMNAKDAQDHLIEQIEEMAVVGIKAILIIHPKEIRDDIRSSKFRKEVGSLGLKFKMDYINEDTQTLISNISY